MPDTRFSQFYSSLLFTALLPYLPYILPFLPNQIFGFNYTGWAWMLMLMVTVVQLPNTRRVTFPGWAWLPWMVYMIVYIVVDFSFLGLQLTLQYLLPLLIGIMASGFTYSEEKLRWLFDWFIRLCVAVMIMFAIGRLFKGYTPAAASTPMLLSVAASLLIGIYYMTKENKYLVYFGLLFLVPFIDLTRMGIAAFLAIFILHFANRKITGKIFYGLLGLGLVIIVFNTKDFQEKTFYGGQGRMSDLKLNYYENENINTSGRSSWKNALEPGLKAAPIWGNGPRSDIKSLITVTGLKTGEAHNDYMSVRYNYGYVGLGLLLFGFGASFLALLGLLRQLTDTWSYLLATSTLTLFISFLMFMYSDNILKYTIYFPDFFFAMIGIVFSIHKQGLETKTE